MKILFIFILFYNIYCFEEWWEKTNVTILNSENFYNFVGKDKYVVVEFFTKWCRYCKLMAEEFEKFNENIKKNRNDVLITKIDAEHNIIAAEYGIFNFPMIVLFYPNSKKIKKIFNNYRIAEYFEGWVNENCPKIVKKFLNSKNNENYEDIKNFKLNDTTKEMEFYQNEFKNIKIKIEEIEKKIKNINLTELKNYSNFNDLKDDNIIIIKINSYFIIYLIIFLFICKKLVNFILCYFNLNKFHHANE